MGELSLLQTTDKDCGPSQKVIQPPADAHRNTELQMWKTKLTQVEALGRVGYWEVNFETDLFLWSDGACTIFDIEPGSSLTAEFALSFYNEAAQAKIVQILEDARHHQRPCDITVPFTASNGRRGWVRMLGQCDVISGTRRLFGVVRDVTEEHRAEDLLWQLAYVDSLTTLPNRRQLQETLAVALADVGMAGAFALCLIDVDQFKGINDAYGYDIGDEVLKEVGHRLVKAVKPNDLVARLGGDEFAILLFGMRDQLDAARYAKSLIDRIRRPITTGGVTMDVTISVGLAFQMSEEAMADDCLRQADIALCRAKRQGQSQSYVFQKRDGQQGDHNRRLLAQVERGLALNEFVVYYQPIVDLRTRIVRGWEALIRWVHPQQGLLTPAAFLPALNDPKACKAIDEFVLDRSLRQMREWLDAGVPVTCAGVNVSEAQLKRPDLVPLIMSLLDRYALTPDRLKIEVLETAFLGHSTRAVERTLEALSTLGVVSALDDFGTGYASLSHLKRFRVERIKIDRSFVRDICVDPYDRALVKSMIDLGRNIGIRVTAEGIETVDQLALLQEFGCDCGQGYLFGRPMPAEDVPGALASWNQERATLLLGGQRAGNPTHTGLEGSPLPLGAA